MAERNDEHDVDRDEVERDAEPRPRPFWSGTITFGLVSIPVNLYPANRSRRVALRMVDQDGTPLARRYVCPKDGRPLDRDDIVRGYEIEKDEYVVVTNEELERLAPERTRDIDLRRFVPAADLDPMYFRRAYYLTPAGSSTKPYRLLAKTMEEAGRAGIATFVMRGKEYLVAIVAERGILRAETLRFVDEVRSPQDVGLPEPAKPDGAVARRIVRELRKRVADEVPEGELADRDAERLEALAREKLRRGEDVVEAPEAERAPEAEGVIDLMEVLKRSMQGMEPRPARRPRRKAGPSRGAASRAGASKRELYERAQQLGIPGRSRMTRDQLAEAIRRAAALFRTRVRQQAAPPRARRGSVRYLAGRRATRARAAACCCISGRRNR